MGDQIYLVTEGGDELRPMEDQPYSSEDRLQNLLENYPDLLAGDQVDPDDPRRWLLVKREAPVEHDGEESHRWRLDHLFIDQDGIPTLIETKIATNPELRRQVVGQMLDYAANLVEQWSVDRIQMELEKRCEANGESISEVISNHIGADLPDDDVSVNQFWDKIKTNLEAERIRLIIVADKIPSSLLKIVEFLNRQMNPCELLALELKQFVYPGKDSVTTLVPRVFGQTSVSRSRRKATRTGNDPGIYILEPIADRFEKEFGMVSFRNAYKNGCVRMHHPGGLGRGEWLIYQSRGKNRLTISRTGEDRLDKDQYENILKGCEGIKFPKDIEFSHQDEQGVYGIEARIPGFQYDDDTQWDSLRDTLTETMRLLLKASQ